MGVLTEREPGLAQFQVDKGGKVPSSGAFVMPAPSATLPETGFLRLSHILGDPKTDPPTPAILPISRASWWAGIKAGRYPKGVKLGQRSIAWRVEDIRALIDRLAAGKAATEQHPE